MVALANAWQTGAFSWDDEKRRNLLAVRGSLNEQKKAADAAGAVRIRGAAGRGEGRVRAVGDGGGKGGAQAGFGGVRVGRVTIAAADPPSQFSAPDSPSSPIPDSLHRSRSKRRACHAGDFSRWSSEDFPDEQHGYGDELSAQPFALCPFWIGHHCWRSGTLDAIQPSTRPWHSTCKREELLPANWTNSPS